MTEQNLLPTTEAERRRLCDWLQECGPHNTLIDTTMLRRLCADIDRLTGDMAAMQAKYEEQITALEARVQDAEEYANRAADDAYESQVQAANAVRYAQQQARKERERAESAEWEARRTRRDAERSW